jgi:hypothetical protein
LQARISLKANTMKLNLVKPFLLFITLLLIVSLACNKENSNKSKKDPLIANDLGVSVYVVFTGIVAADGCGWLIKTDSAYYHADNLPEEFLSDSLNVNVKYDLLLESKFQCGMLPDNRLPVIHLKSIVKAAK